MPNRMSQLASSYLDSIERTESIRDEMIEMLRAADKQFAYDEEGRQLALRELQRDLYQMILADKLRDLKRFASSPRSNLLGEAEAILEKRPNSERLSRPPIDMRTVEEEKMYGALRVRWFELMKEAGIRALRSGPQR